jgi:hypothetical protein
VKRRIFIIVFLVMAYQCIAQTNTKRSLNVDPYRGQNVVLYVHDPVTGNYYAVQTDSTGAIKTVNSLSATSANQTNGAQTTMITGSPNSYGTFFTTAGTNSDSVSFGFTTRSITFINDNTYTDTLFISPVKTFPITNRWKRMGGEGLTKSWAGTKLYFKVGTVPAASKKIRIEAQ